MNKLRNKVYLVICLILTMFLLTILFVFSYQNYKNEINNISTSLFRLNDSNRFFPMGDMTPVDKPLENNENKPLVSENAGPKIFMDSSIYVVKLDEEDKIIEIVNHTLDEINESRIRELAERIINEKENSKVKISNLIFDDYSYLFTERTNSLIIMDNSNTHDTLMSSLRTTLILFIILELIVIYISKKLTGWIIKPVIETFNKQKQFIADASHELKTPLAVIMASAEVLENDSSELQCLENIKYESERMNNLITDLLELAKSENGIQTQYSFENISKSVEKSVLTFESLIFEKDIELKYDIQENINLLCNGSQIKQLVSILIDNAIKHCDSKGKIIINLKKEKGNIVLDVTNTGKEIPKESREKIFERFYRVDESRNRNDNRYGLGLAIAKNIVTNHDGTIQVNCDNGYTTFKVIIKSKS